MKHNRQSLSLWAAALVALNPCTTHGATILEGLTSVDTLDYTNVIGAWNFVDANSRAMGVFSQSLKKQIPSI